MLQAEPCFFNGAGLTPSDVAELRHPVTARRGSGLVKDQELNVEICSVFPILFAVHPEVGADVVVGGYLLPPAGNAECSKPRLSLAIATNRPPTLKRRSALSMWLSPYLLLCRITRPLVAENGGFINTAVGRTSAGNVVDDFPVDVVNRKAEFAG